MAKSALLSHRFIALLMLFQFCGMAVMPCTDKPCKEETSSPYSQHSHEEMPDGCSPLCVCDCCNLNIALPAKVFFTSVLALPKIEVFIQKNALPIEMPKEFWQPPKL